MGELDRISLVSILNERRSQALGALGRSFSVQYERWNASRDVVGFFRDHPVYRIDTLTDIPPSRVSRPAPRYNNNRSPPAYNDNRSPHHGRPTYTAEGDNRSIWISNLEADVTDEELDHLVSHLGRVVSYRIGVSRLPTQGRTSSKFLAPSRSFGSLAGHGVLTCGRWSSTQGLGHCRVRDPRASQQRDPSACKLSPLFVICLAQF